MAGFIRFASRQFRSRSARAPLLCSCWYCPYSTLALKQPVIISVERYKAGGDGGGRGPQIVVSNTRGTGPDPWRPALAAATLEAANGMTSHSQTCYADIVKCLARRRPRDAEFGNASDDFASAHDGRRSIHNRPARPPPEILAPCWIKPKRQSTSGAVRGREASL